MRITKTTAQAQAEKVKDEKLFICPECGSPSFGIRRYRYDGPWFFRTKTTTVYCHSCIECGCEWEYDEK